MRGTNVMADAARDAAAVREMRGWLEDCGADCRGRDAADIAGAVERAYAGGIVQFYRDAGLDAPASTPDGGNGRACDGCGDLTTPDEAETCATCHAILCGPCWDAHDHCPPVEHPGRVTERA